MHQLTFSDDRFDVVYSRHSFEHAFDKRKAGWEFVRVLCDGGVVVVEVPGRYQGGADYNRFDSIEDVTVAFEPHVGAFLHKEYSRREENADKMDIIRVIFHVDKNAGDGAARNAAPVAR
jgi:ubiquinone/menaquinone biosynthesis C-methylase UbiE